MLLVSLLAPQNTGVLFRDFRADPWQVIWGLPACFLPMCLSPALDYMEAALPRGPRGRRAVVLAATSGVALLLMALSAPVAGRSPVAGATTLLLASSLTLVIATVLGQGVAGPATFTFLLSNWVFGLSELSYRPHVWAVLMQPASPSLLACASAVLVAAGALWCLRGSATR